MYIFSLYSRPRLILKSVSKWKHRNDLLGFGFKNKPPKKANFFYKKQVFINWFKKGLTTKW